MTFSDLLYQMQTILASGGALYELAVSAWKMLDPLNIDPRKNAWTEGPVLESPGNLPPIRHDHPYVLKSGKYNEYITALLVGNLEEKLLKALDGHVKAPIQMNPESYIAHSSIIRYFTLMEEYEVAHIEKALRQRLPEIDTERFTFKQILENGIDQMMDARALYLASVYARKSVSKRLREWPMFGLSSLPEAVASKYAQMADFRNRLAHENKTVAARMQSAIEFYYFSVLVSLEMGKVFTDKTAIYEHPFKLFGDRESAGPFSVDHKFA
jgi:uncharacterized protein YutE (UPF0331/DUF86 family)